MWFWYRAKLVMLMLHNGRGVDRPVARRILPTEWQKAWHWVWRECVCVYVFREVSSGLR